MVSNDPFSTDWQPPEQNTIPSQVAYVSDMADKANTPYVPPNTSATTVASAAPPELSVNAIANIMQAGAQQRAMAAPVQPQEQQGTVGKFAKGVAHGVREDLADMTDTLDWFAGIAADKMGAEKGGLFTKLTQAIRPSDFDKSPDSFAYTLGTYLGYGGAQLVELMTVYSKVFKALGLSKGVAGAARMRDIPTLLKGGQGATILAREAIRKSGQAVGAAAEFAAKKPGLVGKVLETPLHSMATLAAFGLPGQIKQTERASGDVGDYAKAIGTNIVGGAAMAVGFNVANSLSLLKRMPVGAAGFGALAALEGPDRKDIAANAVTGALFMLLGGREKDLKVLGKDPKLMDAATAKGMAEFSDPMTIHDRMMKGVRGEEVPLEKVDSRAEKSPLPAGFDSKVGLYGDVEYFRNAYRDNFEKTAGSPEYKAMEFKEWLSNVIDHQTNGKANEPNIAKMVNNIVGEITGVSQGQPYITPDLKTYSKKARTASKAPKDPTAIPEKWGPYETKRAIVEGSNMEPVEMTKAIKSLQSLTVKVQAAIDKKDTAALHKLQPELQRVREKVHAAAFAVEKGLQKAKLLPEDLVQRFQEAGYNSQARLSVEELSSKLLPKKVTPEVKPIEGVKKGAVEETKPKKEKTSSQLADEVRQEGVKKGKKAAPITRETEVETNFKNLQFDDRAAKVLANDAGLTEWANREKLTPLDISTTKDGAIVPLSKKGIAAFDRLASGAITAEEAQATRLIDSFKTELKDKEGNLLTNIADIKKVVAKKILELNASKTEDTPIMGKVEPDMLDFVATTIQAQNEQKILNRTKVEATPEQKQSVAKKMAMEKVKTETPEPFTPLENSFVELQTLTNKITAKTMSGLKPNRVEKYQKIVADTKTALEEVLAGEGRYKGRNRRESVISKRLVKDLAKSEAREVKAREAFDKGEIELVDLEKIKNKEDIKRENIISRQRLLVDPESEYRRMSIREKETAVALAKQLQDASDTLASIQTGKQSLAKMKIGGRAAGEREIQKLGIAGTKAASEVMEEYSKVLGVIETARVSEPSLTDADVIPYTTRQGPGKTTPGHMTRAMLGQAVGIGKTGFQYSVMGEMPEVTNKSIGPRTTGFRRHIVNLEKRTADIFDIRLFDHPMDAAEKSGLVKDISTIKETILTYKRRGVSLALNEIKKKNINVRTAMGAIKAEEIMRKHTQDPKLSELNKQARRLQEELKGRVAQETEGGKDVKAEVAVHGFLERKEVPQGQGKPSKTVWEFRWPRFNVFENPIDPKTGKVIAKTERLAITTLKTHVLNKELEISRLQGNTSLDPSVRDVKIAKAEEVLKTHKEKLASLQETPNKEDLWDKLPFTATTKAAERQISEFLRQRGLEEELIPSKEDMSIETTPMDVGKKLSVAKINEPSGWEDAVGPTTGRAKQIIQKLTAKEAIDKKQFMDFAEKTNLKTRLGAKTDAEVESLFDIRLAQDTVIQPTVGKDAISVQKAGMNRLETLRGNVSEGLLKLEEVENKMKAYGPEAETIQPEKDVVLKSLKQDSSRLMTAIETIDGIAPANMQEAMGRAQSLLDGFSLKAAKERRSSEVTKGLFEAQDVAHTRQVGGALEEAKRRVTDSGRSIYASLSERKGNPQNRVARTDTIKDYVKYNDIRMNEKDRASLNNLDPIEAQKTFMPVTDLLSQPTQSRIEDVRKLAQSIDAEVLARNNQIKKLISNPDSLINQIQENLNKSSEVKPNEAMSEHFIHGTEATDPFMRKAMDLWKTFSDSVADVSNLKSLRLYVNNYFPLIADMETTYHKIRARWSNIKEYSELPERYKIEMDLEKFNEVKAIMRDKEFWNDSSKPGRTMNQHEREIIQNRIYQWDGIFEKWDHLPSTAQERQLLSKDKFNKHLEHRADSVDYLAYKHDAVEVMKQYIFSMSRTNMMNNIVSKDNVAMINKWPDARATGSVRWFMEKQIKAAFGQKTSMEKWAESTIERANKMQQMVVLNPEYAKTIPSRLVASTAKGVLGVDTAIRNATQQIQTIVDKGPYLYAKGLKEYITHGLGEHQKYWDALNLGGESFEGEAGIGRNRSLKERLAPEKGLGRKALEFYDWLGDRALTPMRYTEHWNKAITFLTSLEEAKMRGQSFENGVRLGLKTISSQVPDLVIPEVYLNAYRDTLRTQYGYSLSHKSPLLRGPLARMSTIFWSYPANTIQFLTSGLKESWNQGDNSRFARFACYLGFQLTAAAGFATLGYDVGAIWGLGLLPVKPLSLPWEILYKGYVGTFGGDTEADRSKAREGVANAMGNLFVPQFRFGKKVLNNIQNIDRGYRVGGAKEIPMMETNPITEILDMIGAPPIAPKQTYELMSQMADLTTTQNKSKQKLVLSAVNSLKTGDMTGVRKVMDDAKTQGIPLTYKDIYQTKAIQQQKTVLEQRLKSVPKNLKPVIQRKIDELQQDAFPNKKVTNRTMWSSGNEQ